MEMSFTLKDLREVDINILDEKEKQKCEEAFFAFDKNQSKTLEKEELKKVLEEMGQNPTDEEVMQMIYEVDQTGEGAISKWRINKDLDDFMRIIALQKHIQIKNDEEDIYMAYLALGGDPEKKKHIDREKLVAVLQDEFALTIDVQRLIKEIDLNGSNEIEYQEFKNLLTY